LFVYCLTFQEELADSVAEADRLEDIKDVITESDR